MIMLQHFYDDFLDKVPRQLPQLLDTTRMEEPKFYDDFVLLTLRMILNLSHCIIMFQVEPVSSDIAPVLIPIQPLVRCSR